MGRLPCGSGLGLVRPADVVAVVFMDVESNVFEEESPVLAVDDDTPGLRVLLYLEPGYPGLAGSSKVLDFLDNITTTRPIFGRKFGSPWTHSNPMCMHNVTCSVIADDANFGSIISMALFFL